MLKIHFFQGFDYFLPVLFGVKSFLIWTHLLISRRGPIYAESLCSYKTYFAFLFQKSSEFTKLLEQLHFHQIGGVFICYSFK